MHEKGLNVGFVWVSAHVGVEENEAVDTVAKLSLKRQTVDLNVPLSKAEGKVIIKSRMMGKCQQYRDLNDTGRHLYNIQEKVRGGRMRGRNRKEEVLLTPLRIGHTGLNQTLCKIGKHPTGLCESCEILESVSHVLLECRKYEEERGEMFQVLKNDIANVSVQNILEGSSWNVIKHLMIYLKNTGLMERV